MPESTPEAKAREQIDTIHGVEEQSAKFKTGVGPGKPAWRNPLPLACESTGVETHFANPLDAEPRERQASGSSWTTFSKNYNPLPGTATKQGIT